MTQIKRSSCSYFIHIILVLYSSSCSTLFPMEKYRSIPYPNLLLPSHCFCYIFIYMLSFISKCRPHFHPLVPATSFIKYQDGWYLSFLSWRSANLLNKPQSYLWQISFGCQTSSCTGYLFIASMLNAMDFKFLTSCGEWRKKTPKGA